MNISKATSSATHQSSASPELLWSLLTDVGNWKNWNAGVLSSKIEGDFKEGSRLSMVLPDQQVIVSTLKQVQLMKSFTDVAELGDISVAVRHVIEPLDTGGTQILFELTVIGEGAEEICASIGADFPDVLRALSALAQAQEKA
jgi:hypothetical protein